MNSSKKTSNQNLHPSVRQSERFLEFLANLTPERAEEFWRRYRDLFPPNAFELTRSFQKASSLQEAPAEEQKGRQNEKGEHGSSDRRSSEPTNSRDMKFIAGELRSMSLLLRRAWAEPDQQKKEWKLILVRIDFALITAETACQFDEQPPPSGMDNAFRHLMRIADRAKVCMNEGCKTPFFIAARGSQMFCSEPCAATRQAEYKRRWWQDNAERIRNERSTKRKKPKGKKARQKKRVF